MQGADCSAVEKELEGLANEVRLQKHEIAGLNKRFEAEQTAHESTVAELQAAEAAAKTAQAESKRLTDVVSLELKATEQVKAQLKKAQVSASTPFRISTWREGSCCLFTESHPAICSPQTFRFESFEVSYS
jgi:septal ring factor EnvC (AmiA/AmiB activator)